MPEPLRWNTPGLKWSSGLKWNGTTASTPKRKPMSTTKAIIDFSRYSAADLGPVATHIHTEMTANAATFPDPPVTLTALGTLITTYSVKLAARASRATADILAFNTARDALESALAKLGGYVNAVADGDPAIVGEGGFPSYDSARSVDTSPPAAPTNVRLSHGDLSGSINVRYRTERQPSSNEIQLTTGEPGVAEGWHTVGYFQGQKAVLSGLTPGTSVWVRIRTTGLKGVMGEWSDPAEIRVV
jgi:hypothetical protein